MSHLMRDKAPITDAAWAQIDAEATRSLTHFLAGRKLVDFSGPHGWEHSAVDLGRVQPLPAGPVEGVTATQRRVQPLIELRTPFTVSRAELDAADRGAPDLDLDAVMIAARA
ncbi:MAG: family 1 encapsulin nanocompartment shell protein, partial [Acidimicrobiales bacterium]